MRKKWYYIELTKKTDEGYKTELIAKLKCEHLARKVFDDVVKEYQSPLMLVTIR